MPAGIGRCEDTTRMPKPNRQPLPRAYRRQTLLPSGPRRQYSGQDTSPARPPRRVGSFGVPLRHPAAPRGDRGRHVVFRRKGSHGLQGTAHRPWPTREHVGVDHRGPQVRVPQQLLHGPDVVAVLEEAMIDPNGGDAGVDPHVTGGMNELAARWDGSAQVHACRMRRSQSQAARRATGPWRGGQLQSDQKSDRRDPRLRGRE